MKTKQNKRKPKSKGKKKKEDKRVEEEKDLHSLSFLYRLLWAKFSLTPFYKSKNIAKMVLCKN